MTTPVMTPYRSSQQPGRDGFAQLLRAEWTKFRTVRGWVIGMVAAAGLTALATVALAGTAQNNNSLPSAPPGLAASPRPTRSISCTSRWPKTAASRCG